MRTYRVAGMTREACARSVERAIRARVTGDVAVEADHAAGVVRVGEDADPQVVAFAIEGAGYRVDAVED